MEDYRKTGKSSGGKRRGRPKISDNVARLESKVDFLIIKLVGKTEETRNMNIPSIPPPRQTTYGDVSAELVEQAQPGRLVELNMANVDDLLVIPMLGENRARTILSTRQRNRGFHNWNDVEKIPGFSKGMIGKLQEYCTVDGKTIEDYMKEESQTRSRFSTLPPSKPEDIRIGLASLLETMKASASPEEKGAIDKVLEKANKNGNGNGNGGDKK